MTKKPIAAKDFNGMQSKDIKGRMNIVFYGKPMTCAEIRTKPVITCCQRKRWNKAMDKLWAPLIKEMLKIMKRHGL